MPVIFLIVVLPLLEIAGFVVIGGKIGLGATLVWLAAAAYLGFRVLTTPRAPRDSPAFDMFEGLCLMAAGLLLIVPGFVSDALALGLLCAPLRRIAFALLRDSQTGVFKDMGDFADRYGPPRQRTDTTIEGDFKRLE